MDATTTIAVDQSRCPPARWVRDEGPCSRKKEWGAPKDGTEEGERGVIRTRVELRGLFVSTASRMLHAVVGKKFANLFAIPWPVCVCRIQSPSPHLEGRNSYSFLRHQNSALRHFKPFDPLNPSPQRRRIEASADIPSLGLCFEQTPMR